MFLVITPHPLIKDVKYLFSLIRLVSFLFVWKTDEIKRKKEKYKPVHEKLE